MLNFVPSTVHIVPVLLEMVKPVEEDSLHRGGQLIHKEIMDHGEAKV
jgi:hypothetical protein